VGLSVFTKLVYGITTAREGSCLSTAQFGQGRLSRTAAGEGWYLSAARIHQGGETTSRGCCNHQAAIARGFRSCGRLLHKFHHSNSLSLFTLLIFLCTFKISSWGKGLKFALYLRRFFLPRKWNAYGEAYGFVSFLRYVMLTSYYGQWMVCTLVICEYELLWHGFIRQLRRRGWGGG